MKMSDTFGNCCGSVVAEDFGQYLLVNEIDIARFKNRKHTGAVAHAINNHDRLTEENKQQRESLDAFRELVKAQTKTIHDLNEENTALQRENADLKDKTLKLTTTMYQLRDYLSDIEYDLDQADSVFTIKDEIALIDETLTIRKE